MSACSSLPVVPLRWIPLFVFYLVCFVLFFSPRLGLVLRLRESLSGGRERGAFIERSVCLDSSPRPCVVQLVDCVME